MAALKSIKQLRSTKEKLKVKDAVPTVPVHEYSSFSFYDFNGEPQFKQFFKFQGNHFEQLGSSMPLRGFSRLGPGMSVLDMMSLGSGMSLRSFGRLGSAFSVYGMSRLGSTLSFLAALAAVRHVTSVKRSSNHIQYISVPRLRLDHPSYPPAQNTVPIRNHGFDLQLRAQSCAIMQAKFNPTCRLDLSFRPFDPFNFTYNFFLQVDMSFCGSCNVMLMAS